MRVLTNAEAADVSPALAQQQAIARLGITISQYARTVQGKNIIQDERPFILGAQVYQGFRGMAVLCEEKQLTDAEIDEAMDVDGSKATLLRTREERLAGHRLLKNAEMAGRKKLAVAADRDELELQILRKQAEGMGIGTTTSELTEPEPEPDTDPGEGPAVASCPACGKSFTGKTAARRLHAHRMGAKH